MIDPVCAALKRQFRPNTDQGNSYAELARDDELRGPPAHELLAVAMGTFVRGSQLRFIQREISHGQIWQKRRFGSQKGDA